jgi:hypothetical protein
MFTQRSLPLFSLLSLLSAAFALSGCSNMVGTAPPAIADVQPGTLSGTVHGGTQPVVNATVTLWAAGNTGYGSAATQLATATTGATGGFSFGPGSGNSYSCPLSNSATASQSIYITVSGGQPTTGVTNGQAAFMVALGDCVSTQTANPAVNINEVTTVASMTALQQFFTPSSSGLGSFGTTPTNTLGLSNAMKTVANLVNIASGTAYASTTVAGIIPSYTTSVTITPEQAKINTMADILAACVNGASGSSACTTLFANVGNTTPKDTLQAAYYMATNPTSTTSSSTVTTCTTGTHVTTTSTICNLYGLVGSQVPFAPTVSAAPTDWTIGVTYGSTSSQTIGGTAVYLFNSPEYVALDSVGNVWVLNSTTSAAGAVGNSVTELSPVGVPKGQVLTAAGQLTGPRNIILDPSNNVFVGNYGISGTGTSVEEYNSSTLTAENFPLVSVGPAALASDGAGNIYVADQGVGTSGGAGDLEIIPAGSIANTTATQIGANVSAGPNSMLVIDSYNDLWLSNFGNTATTQFICSQRPCVETLTTAGGASAPKSIVVDHSNNIWIGNSGSPGSMSELAATNSTTIIGASGSPLSGGGLSNPTYAIFGGLGSQWITNSNGSNGSVTELSAAGAPISPSVGFQHTYNGPIGIGIDASGNVWLGNASAAPSGFITEIIGAAGPTITPYAANLPVSGGGANTIGNEP